jgi:hypothetical protein
MGKADREAVVERYLFHVEACPDVDEHPVGVGELAFDVEGVGERDEDGLLFCCGGLVRQLGEWQGASNARCTHCRMMMSPT